MSRLRRAARVVPFLLFMVALAAILLWVLNQLATGDQERERQQAEITALQSGLAEANARLEAQGEPPVPVPETEPGDAPPVVPIAPTQTQILSAFDVWCDLRSCHGSDGEDGDDAPPMTQEQIFAGFTEWCSTDPRCVGEPGRDGADSTTPGPPGRPPTAQEILAAVEAVCADGACDGTDGTNGKDGRGVADVECRVAEDVPNDGGDWLYHYTDGTTETVEGPCRVVQPTPSPPATTTKGR